MNCAYCEIFIDLFNDDYDFYGYNSAIHKNCAKFMEYSENNVNFIHEQTYLNSINFNKISYNSTKIA